MASRSVWRRVREGRIGKNTALEAVHDIEGRSDDAIVVAVNDDARYRHIRLRQRLQHAIFAIDGMSRPQDRPGRLLPHHEPPVADRHEIGRVGLASRYAFKMKIVAIRAVHARAEKGFQTRGVEFRGAEPCILRLDLEADACGANTRTFGRRRRRFQERCLASHAC